MQRKKKKTICPRTHKIYRHLPIKCADKFLAPALISAQFDRVRRTSILNARRALGAQRKQPDLRQIVAAKSKRRLKNSTRRLGISKRRAENSKRRSNFRKYKAYIFNRTLTARKRDKSNFLHNKTAPKVFPIRKKAYVCSTTIKPYYYV